MTDRVFGHSSDRPSTPGLIGDAIRQATDLFATEIALVRFEATEKLALALASVAGLVLAAVFMVVALIFLSQGLAAVLVQAGLPAFEADFLIGGILALLALIAFAAAARTLGKARLKPARTLRQIKVAETLVRGKAR